MTRSAVRQLPLAFGAIEPFAFELFLPGPNLEVCQALNRLAAAPLPGAVYLWGRRGSGKSHLLQALCKEAFDKGFKVAYLTLRENDQYAPEVLDGLENLDVICLDDIDAIAGITAWEHAVFHLVNRLRAAARPLVMAGGGPPQSLGLGLADLGSRIQGALSYQLKPLADSEMLAALQLRATARGLELTSEVGEFLLRRYPRDMAALCRLLDGLDEASLAAQRRLTIPFVRQWLEDHRAGD